MMFPAPMNPRNFFEAVVRYVLGGVFLYAAFSKLVDPAAFAQDISNYRLLPGFLHAYGALLIPALELAAGILVIAGPVKGEAAAWLALLLVGFLAGEIQALVRGLDLSCGCFGKSSGKVGLISIGRNALLLAGALWVMREEFRLRTRPPAWRGEKA